MTIQTKAISIKQEIHNLEIKVKKDNLIKVGLVVLSLACFGLVIPSYLGADYVLNKYQFEPLCYPFIFSMIALTIGGCVSILCCFSDTHAVAADKAKLQSLKDELNKTCDTKASDTKTCANKVPCAETGKSCSHLPRCLTLQAK
jgi:hypothetical protein